MTEQEALYKISTHMAHHVVGNLAPLYIIHCLAALGLIKLEEKDAQSRET